MATPLLLGVEIGGTKLQVALGTEDGSILAIDRRPVQPERGARGIWSQITGAVEPLIAGIGARRGDVVAVGVGFGGPVDTGRGVVVRSHQVAGWDSAPLAEWVRRDLGIPTVAVHNDADAAALAEARIGAGAGLSPVLYVNSGSGVGGGLVIDGRIYRGGSGLGAVEIGHVHVFPEASGDGQRRGFAAEGWAGGPLGRPLTLEQVASGWSIGRSGAWCVEQDRRHGREIGPSLVALSGGDPARVTAEVVAEAAAMGDEEAIRILDDATTAFAQALAHAVTLLAPRRIVLGGGASLMDPVLWMDPIREKLAGRVFEPFRGTYEVVPAALGERVVVHGAIVLASDAWRSRGAAPE